MEKTVDVDWWKNTVIYHIYLPAFKDSNNDGIGDFQGLISKMDYLSYLGVETLLLSPFYPSPMKDNGYDITHFTGVDPQYGTMEDFDEFMLEAEARGFSIILDLVFNHTSDQHECFLKSVKGEKPYKDYYVWADPKITADGRISPPNNWLSVFGGSAWEWNEERQQFYLHQFLVEQPDLNLRSKEVRKELENVMEFWLNKGVDGFRIDAISHFYEDELLRDEPLSHTKTALPDEYDYLEHIYTKGQPENLSILEVWRSLLTKHMERTGKYKILLTEVMEPLDNTMHYYGTHEKCLSDVPFNFGLTNLHSDFTAADLLKAVQAWMNAMPRGKQPNWILGNHDLPRLATRVGIEMVNGLHMVILLLPGIPLCYYGDELGMENVPINPRMMRDSFALRTKPENSRDPSRTPMQWNSGVNAGFTESKNPWLPVNENSRNVNVEKLMGDPFSVLEIYRSLLKMRKEPAISKGIVEFPFVDGNVFSFIRVMESAQYSKGFLVVLNTGKCCCIVDFSDCSEFLPDEGCVELDVVNSLTSDKKDNITRRYSKYAQERGNGKRKRIQLSDVLLLPKQAMVVSFIPKKL